MLIAQGLITQGSPVSSCTLLSWPFSSGSAMYTQFLETLDSTTTQITSAHLIGMNQASPDVGCSPTSCHSLSFMDHRRAFLFFIFFLVVRYYTGPFKGLGETYVLGSVWTVKYEQTAEIDRGTLAQAEGRIVG